MITLGQQQEIQVDNTNLYGIDAINYKSSLYEYQSLLDEKNNFNYWTWPEFSSLIAIMQEVKDLSSQLGSATQATLERIQYLNQQIAEEQKRINTDTALQARMKELKTSETVQKILELDNKIYQKQTELILDFFRIRSDYGYTKDQVQVAINNSTYKQRVEFIAAITSNEELGIAVDFLDLSLPVLLEVANKKKLYL